MQPAPALENEERRLASLRSLGVLDTPSEARFDELVELAAHIAHTPIAMMTLIDLDREWFKSRLGLNRVEARRITSFCGHAIAESRTMVVADTLDDERFADNPSVTGAPGLRFYAGVPLIVDEDLAIGTLCVLDTRPRTLLSDDRRAIETVGRQITTQLRLDRLTRQMEALRAELPNPPAEG